MAKRSNSKAVTEKLTELSLRIEAVEHAVHLASQVALETDVEAHSEAALKAKFGGMYGVLALAARDLERINNEMSEVRL
jgi:hypothetical protein